MLAAIRFLLCVVLVVLPGCASYVSHSVRIKSELAEGRFEKALEEVDKAEDGSSRLLALYESGLILHYAQDYQQSNLRFHEAERLYDDLYTKSISREAAALLTSDVIIDYRGERLESAYIHYYKILNYLHLGNGESALVECRKLNQRLKSFRDATGTFYTDDPFLQHLTGLVYESEGELQDAWVSYRVALENLENPEEGCPDPPPVELACAFQRVSSKLGYSNDAPTSAEEVVCPEQDATRDGGSVVVLVEEGFVPHKVSVDLVVPLFENDFDQDMHDEDFAWALSDRVQDNRVYPAEVKHWLKIAFPKMVAEMPLVGEVEVVAVEVPVSAVRAPRVADVGVATLRRFDERRPAMLAKTVARALAKYLAKEGAEKEKGELAGLAVNIFNIATETADTRSWSTLPGRIYLARLPLPEGTYTLQITLRDRQGDRLDTIAIPDVEVLPGQTTFLNHRVF